MREVRFNYADVRGVSLRNKKSIKKAVFNLFEKEGKVLQKLDYVFCSDTYLLSVNQSFLKHDYYTDIITFNLSEKEEIAGEVYISIDRVKENAAKFSSTFSKELVRVIFHGALHLCGYRDKKKSEITIMREKEEYYLRSLF